MFGYEGTPTPLFFGVWDEHALSTPTGSGPAGETPSLSILPTQHVSCFENLAPTDFRCLQARGWCLCVGIRFLVEQLDA